MGPEKETCLFEDDHSKLLFFLPALTCTYAYHTKFNDDQLWFIKQYGLLRPTGQLTGKTYKLFENEMYTNGVSKT